MRMFKYTLLFIILGLFCFHAVQRYFHVFKKAALTSVWDTTTYPALSRETYKSRRFQLAYEKFTEEKMGFRPQMVRLKNQLDYSLFRYSIAPTIVIGKQDMLFSETYIINYKGIIFKGAYRIIRDVSKLRVDP